MTDEPKYQEIFAIASTGEHVSLGGQKLTDWEVEVLLNETFASFSNGHPYPVRTQTGVFDINRFVGLVVRPRPQK